MTFISFLSTCLMFCSDIYGCISCPSFTVLTVSLSLSWRVLYIFCTQVFFFLNRYLFCKYLCLMVVCVFIALTVLFEKRSLPFLWSPVCHICLMIHVLCVLPRSLCLTQRGPPAFSSICFSHFRFNILIVISFEQFIHCIIGIDMWIR